MGTSKRTRRADKKRKNGGRTTPPGAPSGAGGPRARHWPPPPGDVGRDQDRAFARLEQHEAELLRAAVAIAVADLPDAVLQVTLTRFEEAAAPFGPDHAPQRLAERLADSLHEAWPRGWLPADLRCLLRKRDGAVRELLAIAIHDEAKGWARANAPDVWQRQLADLDDDPVRRLVATGVTDPISWLTGPPGRTPEARRAALCSAAIVIGSLITLPTIPILEPVPDTWGEAPARRGPSSSTIDPAILAKVRALLAKAESTTFEAEAMALTAKAQSLIAKHAIDAAVLAAADHDGDDEQPSGRRLPVDDPYAQEKAILLSAITDANRCRAVWSKSAGFSTVFGFRSDLDAVELLFTSLLVQASTAMQAAGPQKARDGRSTTRSFRQSFLVGYASRIGQRLADATAGTVRDAETSAGTSLVPVLAAREEQVGAATDEAFPQLKTYSGGRVSNRAGFVAGQVAADRAQLGPGVAVAR